MAKSKVVGLDMGTTAVRAAVVSYGSAGPTGTGVLHTYGEGPVPPGAVRDGEVIEINTVSAAIKRLWSGAKITNVVIAQKGVPHFVRVLPNGGHDVTDAVAGAMSLSGHEAEQLKREVGVGYTMPPERQAAAQAIADVTRSLIDSVRDTFTYFTQANAGATIDGVLVTGGGGLLPGFTQYLSSVSRLPVYLANPLDNLDVSKSAQSRITPGYEGTTALAIGLGSAAIS